MIGGRFLEKNDSLRIRPFRYYLALRFALIFSLNWQTAVVSYMVYELTRHTEQGPELFLGLMGLAEVVPAVLGSLLAGPVVERREKRGILLLCVGTYFFLSLFFVGLAWPLLQDALGLSKTLALIYTGIFIGGLARAFWSPAAFSLVGLLVPRVKLANATTWSSMAWQSGAVIGPLAGGLLLAPLGYEASLFCVTGLQIIAITGVFGIPKQPVFAVKKAGESMLASVGEGLRFVFRNQLVLTALSLDLFAVLFGGATALLPIYANDILHVGESGYGWLKAAPGIGSVITLLILSWLPLKTHPGWKLLLAVGGFGVCTLIFGACASFRTSLQVAFYIALAALVLMGMFDGISVVIRGLILQLKTPNAMRGRVAAVNTMFVSSSNEIGSLESGLTARWLGTVPAVLLGGALTILTVVAAGFAAPKLRSFDIAEEAAKEDVPLG